MRSGLVNISYNIILTTPNINTIAKIIVNLYQFLVKQVTPLKLVTIERDSCTNSTNCNSNLELIMEITTKHYYYKALEIDVMQSFFKLFIIQA